MKQAFVVLMCLASLFAKGQDSVVYKPVFYSLTYQSVNVFVHFSALNSIELKDSLGISYKPSPDPDNIVSFKIANDRTYFLSYRASRNNLEWGPMSIIHPIGQNEIIDTIYIENVQPFWMGGFVKEHSNTFYTEPNVLAQGYWEGKYHNGNTYFKSTFKDGKPIDTLFRYFVDGSIKSKYYEDSAKGIIFHEEYFFNKNRDLQEGKYVNNQDSTEIKVHLRCDSPYKKVVSSGETETTYYKIGGKWVDSGGVSLKIKVIGSHPTLYHLYDCEGFLHNPDSTRNRIYYYSNLPPGDYFFDEIHMLGYSGNRPYRNKVMYQNNFNLIINLSGKDTLVEKTYYTPKIYRSFYRGEPSTMVFNTYDTAYHIDTFYNGQVRFKGYLYKGQPRDTIFIYYSDGSLREITYYNVETGEIWHKAWYPDGQLRVSATGIVVDDSSECLRKLYLSENPLEYPLNFKKDYIIDMRDYIPSFCSYEYYRYTMDGYLEFYEYHDSSKMEGIRDSDATPKGYEYSYVIDSLFEYKYFDRRTGNTEYTLTKKFSKKDKIDDAYYEEKIIYKDNEPVKKIVTKRNHKKVTYKEYKLINGEWVKYSTKREKIIQ